jgi:hypothetical protein
MDDIKIIHLNFDSFPDCQETLKKSLGQYPQPEDYSTLIDNGNVDVYKPNGELLFKFRKNYISSQICHAALPYLELASKVTGTASRGNASGFNRVASSIIGYYEKPIRSGKYALDKSLRAPCRKTMFNRDYVNEWEQLKPFFETINQAYKELLPDKYEQQSQIIRENKIENFVIQDTIFSTITLNKNLQTSFHIDRGDLDRGYSLIMALEGKGTNWSGGYLCYPRYRIALNLREGDILIMDPHEIHCNTPLQLNDSKACRLSLVFYLRQRILNCNEKLKSFELDHLD